MQRVDLIVNGVTKAVNQKSDSPAFVKRVTAAYQGNARVVVARHAQPPPPPPPPPASSLWSGRGVFTTTNVASSHGLHAAWTAIQKDPEGDRSELVTGQLCFWQARPTLAVMQEANAHGVPYIAQSENGPEFAHALELFDQCPLHVPHALVGKALKSWDWQKAVAQGWDLLLEWYFNNEPSYTMPDADGYPLFRNVVFGTFPSETVPGRRVSVPEYRAIWHGSFSCWDSEGMDEVDRAGYNVP